MPGQDITNLFTRTIEDYPDCMSAARFSTTPLCKSGAETNVKENGTLQACPLGAPTDSTFSTLSIQNSSLLEGYSWAQVSSLVNYMVLDGMVLNLTPYMVANPTPIGNDEVDLAIRQVLDSKFSSGKDATRLFYNRKDTQNAIKCLQTRYLAGRIDKVTPGCFAASLFLYTSLTVILGVVFIRFAMACIFNWFIAARLARPPTDLARNGVSPAVLPEGANMSIHNKAGTAPWANGSATDKRNAKLSNKLNKLNSSSTTLVPNLNSHSTAQPMISLQRIGAELFTVCLVTCYSEGEDSVRGTIESIAATNYSDSRKLIWMVCDGMITGEGEKQSTPDICVSMLEADARFGNPMPMGYAAVGIGAKRENRAMIYAGHYG
jgi:chitin synthase